MANLAKLRIDARNHEMREQWREAIAVYRQMLENPEEGDVDIGLYNRIGDLHLRLNETELAVQAYEGAVRAYTDVGLYNNAIALCRKILRLVPGRALTYRTLGQISAAKGFLQDARHYFLEYADRMRRAGRLDESFEALKEFADLSPDDAELRRLLADQLVQHGRTEEAIEQLRLLLATLLEGGDEGGAAQVRARIAEVDPEASTEPLVRERRQRDDSLQGAFDTADLYGDAPAAASDPAPDADAGPAARPAGFSSTLLDDAPPADPAEAATVGRIEGFEPTLSDFGAADAPATADEDAEEDDPDPLPLLDDAEGGLEIEPTALDGPAVETPANRPRAVSVFGDPDDYAGDDEDADDAEPLPLLTVDEPAPPARPVRTEEELRARVGEQPEDAEARHELLSLLNESGRQAEVAAVLEHAHRSLAARGRHRDALAPLSELIALRPGVGLLLQKRVEYAFRSGDREALIQAYLALGAHLSQHAEAAKGRAVYQRVLELDPGNAEARAAIAPPATPARAADAPRPAPAAPDYVDLGALVLEEQTRQVGETRFRVEEHEPTGDEDRDFAEMLAHFRQKVAENIEVEDSSSHYDLGVAFKEMGLIDEAIAEFQVALRGGANPLATLELLGQCFVEKGQYAVAARVLDRALRLPVQSDAELVGVLYQLGRSAEALGRGGAAIDYYERVLGVDIAFRDAQRRVEVLRADVRATGG